jgi:DNA polymerase (family 10)
MSINEALAQRLSLIGQMQELLGADKFRAISNERAARVIEGFPVDISTVACDKAKLLEIDGIGPKIADKIVEFCQTGKIKEFDELRTQVPTGLMSLLEIPGLGPKTIRVLWQEGGVEDLAGLKRVMEDGTILKLPRMGEKSVQKLRESLALMQESSKRLPLGMAAHVAERFMSVLRKVEGVEKVEAAGSLRRGKETVGDIDILVAASKAAAASEAFRLMPDVKQVIVGGETKSSVRAVIKPELGRWDDGDQRPQEDTSSVGGGTVQVDLRVIPKESWGAALMYFTGSKEHNVRLRERAQKKGMTLNEYGLFPDDKDEIPPQRRGVKPLAGKTEEEVYKKLGVAWVPAEVREDRRELDLAEAPGLVAITDIVAELHSHTTASDGVMSILELAAEAKKRGFHTIAVTDHSKSSAIANGLSVDRLKAHIKAVHAARKEIDGITILAGSEVDILADGRLDYPDDVLAELDIVVASPHSALSQDAKTATKRIIKAIQNPNVHIIGHPTGRLINRRTGLPLEIGEVIAAAKAHDVALEINAHWLRLDLRDTHVRAAVDAGCKIAIDCDVHERQDFDNLRFGVATGRRGWLTPDLCINTWKARPLHTWLKQKRA